MLLDFFLHVTAELWASLSVVFTSSVELISWITLALFTKNIGYLKLYCRKTIIMLKRCISLCDMTLLNSSLLFFFVLVWWRRIQKNEAGEGKALSGRTIICRHVFKVNFLWPILFVSLVLLFCLDPERVLGSNPCNDLCGDATPERSIFTGFMNMKRYGIHFGLYKGPKGLTYAFYGHEKIKKTFRFLGSFSV